MKEELRALLLLPRETPEAELVVALNQLGISAESQSTCRAAEPRLADPNPPHLVLTGTELPDGTWSDVVDFAERAMRPVNVVVVSPFADVSLYLEVMERRAFDFITHAFTAPELAHVLRCAVDNIRRRRHEHQRNPRKSQYLSKDGRELKEDLIRL